MANLSLHYSSSAPLAGTFAALGQILATWRVRVRARNELARLDYRTARDLGISPNDVLFEASKPFWRA